MNTDVLNNPEKFSIDIRGTFNRNGDRPLIFQRSHGRLQKKIGPIVPANPKSRLQQLNRILFRAAVDNTYFLNDEQKGLYRERINHKKPGMTWRLQAMKAFLRKNSFDSLRFDEGLFFGGVPKRPAYRFDEIAFDDAFLIAEETLPIHLLLIRMKYPNIDLSSLFPETG